MITHFHLSIFTMQTLTLTKFEPLKSYRIFKLRIRGQFNIIFNSNFEKLQGNPILKKKPLPKRILIKQKIFLCDICHVANL